MSSIFDFQGSKKDDFEFPENKKESVRATYLSLSEKYFFTIMKRLTNTDIPDP